MQLRGDQIARIETHFNLRVPASQLLGVPLRPRPGGVAERVLIVGHRMVAAVVRLLGGRRTA